MSPRILIAILLALGLLAAAAVVAEDRSAPPARAPSAKSIDAEVDALLDLYDRNKDGALTRNELPECMRSAFDEIDTNRDGKLDRAELRQGWAALQPRRPSDLLFVLVESSDCDKCCRE
jgi:Ca2+-binding EF-hand superfamily protein